MAGGHDATPGAAPGPPDAAEAEWTAAEVFEGLRDFKHLTRERALDGLQRGLKTSQYSPEEVEPLAEEALRGETWEAKHGGLLAVAEILRCWDRPAFRSSVLTEIPRLLVDREYRVRKAVAGVLLECCRKEGLSIYDGMSDVVLGDIRTKFQRHEEAPPDPMLPPTFLHDTEGWRSLETSMGALEAMMQGCGVDFTPRIDTEMLELLAECTRHTNRFVREYAYFSFKNIFEVCDKDVFLSNVAPQTAPIMTNGILDNWSQVRYAASVAVRAFMQKAGEQRELWYPQLLGPMCLNRHYVAEGVRLYSQETWRFVCGPQGGARLLMAHFDSVIDTYSNAAEAPNHAVREAGCHCISELAARIAGCPAEPTPHREHFTNERVQRLLQTLFNAFQDESWPVRDVSSTALGSFVRAFPAECVGFRPRLVDLWFEQMADNIPSLRRNGAAALGMAMSVWIDDLWADVLPRLETGLLEVLQQAEQSEIFSDYTPSGPFSVPRSKPMSIKEGADPEHTNQTMYSCGSGAPKTFKRRGRERIIDKGGCMNCATDRPHQPWEASEGSAHLLTELALLVAKGSETERLDALAALLPSLAQCFACSHFRHQHLLKQRICERLPALTEALGTERVLPHLPELRRVVVECATQDTYRALRECAEDVVVAWRRQFPPQ